MRNKANQNEACIRGYISAPPTLSHESHGTPFYRFTLIVPRLSGREDRIPVLAPYPLLADCFLTDVSTVVEIRGEVRSFNNRSGIGNRLLIHLFARELQFCQDPPCNELTLGGSLCKPPVLRKTPLGRDICDLLLAINRPYRRADYLPCIAWGTLADSLALCDVGSFIHLSGRLQSRSYVKAGETLERTALEISIMSLL